MDKLSKKNKTWITSAHQGYVRDGVCPNTLLAYCIAAKKGADMIEVDARMTKDGVLIVNHDATVKGYSKEGKAVEYEISETDYDTISSVCLSQNGESYNYVPTLDKALNLAYFGGMCINIDLKEGMLHAREIAREVVASGMRGRTVYATNGAGVEAIHAILEIDPDAFFIDTKANFTKEKLKDVVDYPAKCFVYTSDFSAENIAEIRESGCMLAAISINEKNAFMAFSHHPDMAEYPHTSDFESIDRSILGVMGFRADI